MKGYRFYADYSSKLHKRMDTTQRHVRPGGPTPNPAANAIAVILGDDGRELFNGKGYDCLTGIFDRPNSDVATSGVTPDYLRKRCRRISEAEARRIHPAIFTYLEYEPA